MLAAQVVVSGCEGEIHVYSIFVDDTAHMGWQAVATARQALAEGEAMPQASSPSLHSPDTLLQTGSGSKLLGLCPGPL